MNFSNSASVPNRPPTASGSNHESVPSESQSLIVALVGGNETSERLIWESLIQESGHVLFDRWTIDSLAQLRSQTDPPLRELAKVELLVLLVMPETVKPMLALVDWLYRQSGLPSLVVVMRPLPSSIAPLVSALTHGGIWGVVGLPWTPEQGRAMLDAVSSRCLADREARRCQVSLEQQLIDRNQLAAIALHDSRSAIRAIQSYAQLMDRFWDHWPAEQQRAYLKRIGCLAEKTLSEFNDLTVLIEADSGRLRFEPAWLDVSALLREVVDRCQQIAPALCHITIHDRLDHSQIWADARLFRLITNNLLDNAVKYSPNGGTIEVFLSQQSNFLLLQVRDHGIGICSADQERIFQQFTRGSNVADIPGTGLGLAIIAQCVQLHHGKIELDSELQQGSLFTVWLPMIALGSTNHHAASGFADG